MLYPLNTPRNSKVDTEFSTDFRILIGNPRFCGRYIIVPQVVKTSSVDAPIKCLIIIFMQNCLNREIGTFMSFVYTLGAEERLKQSHRNLYRLPFHWNLTYF